MNIDIIEPSSRIRLPANSKVSAIHHYNDRIIAGLTNGDLVIYSSISKNTDSEGATSAKPSTSQPLKSSNDVKGLFSEKGEKQALEIRFSNITKDNSPIDRISTIVLGNESNRTIISITSTEAVRIYEVVGKHLNLIQELIEVKASPDSLYVETEPSNRLYILGSKKKLFIYKIVNKTRNIIQFQKLIDISLKDKVRSINLYPVDSESSARLLVGLSNNFVLVDLTRDFDVEELSLDEPALYSFSHSSSFSYFGLSSSGPSSWAMQLTKTQLLLIKDTSTVILTVKDDGPEFTTSSVKLTVSPIFVSFINPLYLLVVYSKRIEIIDYDTGDLIQVFNHQINSNQIYVYIDDNDIYLASSADILQFRVLGYQRQIDQFLSISGKGSSTGNVKDPHNDLKIIGLEKSISLVTKIDTASPFFENEAEEHEKRKQLILRELYKKKAVILFQSYSKYHEALVEISSDWLVFYRDILSLFPDFLNAELKIAEHGDYKQGSDEAESVKSLSHSVIKRISLNDIQNTKLSVTTGDSGTDNDNNEQGSNTRSGRNNSSPKPSQNTKGFSKSQNVRKFVKAVNNLIIYLTDQRRIHLNFLDDQKGVLQWKGVEITPFDIYPSLTRSNLRSHLIHIASVIDTTLFLCYFHTKPMLLGPLLRLPNNHCNAKVVNECLLKDIHNHVQQRSQSQPNFIKELLDFYYGRSLHRDALEMLYQLSHEEGKDKNLHDDENDNDFDSFIKGPALTIQYLQKLTGDELDLIFQFSYWVILEEESTEGRITNGKLIFMNDSYECENYDNFKVLNFFVNVLKVDSLGISYLEWLLFESDLIESLTKKKVIAKFHTKLCLLYLKKLKEIIDSKTLDEFTKHKYYVKLYGFLESTNLYEPWTVLKNIPSTDDKFSRFKIFVYKRLGEHEKSIDVLFNQLDDLDSAIAYCADIYSQQHNKKVGEDLLQKLLEDLVMNYHENKDSIEKLLLSQGSKMSIFKVLTSLPNSFPLNKLSTFLTQHLRDSQESLHDCRIASQLYKVGSIKLQDKIWNIQSQGYSIESGKQLCSICERRLGYSVFSVDSQGQIVHYGCAQNAKQ